jgi:hypothetical protein
MDKWGKVSITGPTFTTHGKNWVGAEFGPAWWTLYELKNNVVTDITSNTIDTIITAANGLLDDDAYFIGPTTITNVHAYPEPNDAKNFGKRPKFNRSKEEPIGGVPYAVDDVQMPSGSIEGSYKSENMFQSWLGALCGWVDYDAGVMHFYDQNDYDHVFSLNVSQVGVGYVDNTPSANKRAPTVYTPFALLPAGEVTGDYIVISGAEIFNSVYFNLATLGVPAGGGDPVFTIQYWSEIAGAGGAWADLALWYLDDDLGTTHYFDKADCTLKFTPPHDWIRGMTSNATTPTDYTTYGYMIRLLFDATGGTYTPNPTANFIKLGYVQPTYTIRESFTRGVSPSHTVIHGVHPTKFDLTVQKGEAVTFTMDYVAKGYVKPHTMSTAPFVPKTSRYIQRCYYEGKDITCNWSSPSITDTNITTFKLTIDPKGDAVAYVGGDGMRHVSKNTMDTKCEVEIPYTNDTMLNQYFADPNTDAGKIDLTITARKEKLLVAGIGATAATNNYIDTSAGNAALLHNGQQIMLKEGVASTVYVVASISTGRVYLTTILGGAYTTAASVYIFDYVKFPLSHCIILDTDLDDKSSDNPIKRKFTLQPLGDLGAVSPIIPCQITFKP